MKATVAALSEGHSRLTEGVNRLGRFVFRYRDYLAPLGLILILVGVRPQPLFRSAQLDIWLDAVGLAVAACGQAFRILVIGYAYIDRGGVDKRLAASRLVVDGIYAHSRNPMYVGNFLLLAGLAIIYHSLVVYLVALPIYVLAILAIIKSEEEFLRGKFGSEYEDYCRRVNRFLPHLHGLRATLAGMNFDWRRVVRKEYGTTFAWISVASLLIAWERLSWYGTAAYGTLKGLAVAWLVVLSLYSVARWLKKTRRLN